MANLTASNASSPWVMWTETTGTPIDQWRIVGTASELDVQFYGVAGLAWVSKMKVEPNARLTLSGGNPRLVFEDTTSSSSDFTLGADANLYTLKQDSTTLLEASTTELVSNQPVRIKSTAPSLVLEDTTTSASDFTIAAASSLWTLAQDATVLLTASTSEIIADVAVRIRSTAPSLTFEDTTSAAQDFSFTADADRLELAQAGPATLVRFNSGGAVTFHDASSLGRCGITPNASGDATVRAGDATQGVRGVVHARYRPDTGAPGVLRMEASDGTSVFLTWWKVGASLEFWATDFDPGATLPSGTGAKRIETIP